MLPSSKITDSETAPPVKKPALPAEVSQPSLLSRVVCDLAECAAFSPGYKGPHVPVAAAFGGDRFHECRMSGCFDLDRAIAENATELYRSVRRLSREDSQKPWDDLTFQFGPRSFLYADETRITLAYTRDGSFTKDANGLIVTANGYPLSAPRSRLSFRDRARYRLMREKDHAEWWLTHERKRRAIG